MTAARMVTARLVAAYGDHRVADKAVRELWLRELAEGLAEYPTHYVMKGFGEVIRRCKFWPTIAEIIQHLKPDVPPPQLPRFREPVPPVLTEAEVKRRGEVLKRIKRETGYDAMMARPDPLAAERPKGRMDVDLGDKPLGQHIMELSEENPGISEHLRRLTATNGGVK